MHGATIKRVWLEVYLTPVSEVCPWLCLISRHSQPVGTFFYGHFSCRAFPKSDKKRQSVRSNATQAFRWSVDFTAPIFTKNSQFLSDSMWRSVTLSVSHISRGMWKMGHILIEWDIYWLNGTYIDWMGHVLIEWDTYWLNGTHIDWMGHILIEWDIYWLNGIYIDWMGHILIEWDIYWLNGTYIDWMGHILIEWDIYWLNGTYIDWMGHILIESFNIYPTGVGI